LSFSIFCIFVCFFFKGEVPVRVIKAYWVSRGYSSTHFNIGAVCE